MNRGPYSTLAAVYEWLVPDALLEPEGAVGAFAGVVDRLAPGARVLDCAAGTGQLAVGLALRGFDVVASDASAAMVERTQQLAVRRRVEVPTVVCEWEDLAGLGLEPFDAVVCVGNSLAHAAGRRGRRAALGAMRAVLRRGGVLAVTSRNWERVRSAGSGLQLPDALITRAGRPGLVVRAWHIAGRWDDPHHLEVAVVLLGDDARGTRDEGARGTVTGDARGTLGGDAHGTSVTSHVERLTFWPFAHGDLVRDLRASGLAPEEDTYDPDAERYLVTARGVTARAD